MTNPLILILIFVVSSLVGYFVIKKIPSLLHTPLMSGMNALSGITVIGAILVLIDAYNMSRDASIADLGSGYATLTNIAIILAGLAIILAMVNVVGGFGVTERMLRMFKSKKREKGGGDVLRCDRTKQIHGTKA